MPRPLSRTWWGVIAGSLLTLPAGAYVVATLVSSDADTPAGRTPIVIVGNDRAEDDSAEGADPAPEPVRSPSSAPTGDDEGELTVVKPGPRHLGDDGDTDDDGDEGDDGDDGDDDGDSGDDTGNEPDDSGDDDGDDAGDDSDD